MGYLLPSGNQIIWIRPKFEDSLNNPLGQWGNAPTAPDVNAWFSVAYDPNDSMWVGRDNYDLARNFLGGYTGTAARPNGVSGELYLFSKGYLGGSEPSLVLQSYKYTTESVAAYRGMGYRGEQIMANGAHLWRMQTRYIRQVDASIMTPMERLCEMTQMAVDDPSFSGQMRHQFGMLGDPKVLLMLAAGMGIFIGIGAGAAVVGGLAFANAVGRLLNLSLAAMQVHVYVKLFQDLQTCCFSSAQADFSKGKLVVQTILVTLLTDITLAGAVHGAVQMGTRAAGLLRELVLNFAPAKWLEAGQRGLSDAKALLSKAQLTMGYLRADLLEVVKNPLQLFRKGEVEVLKARSAAEQEMILMRGPSSDRMEWLDKLHGWLVGKPNWIKAKSKSGWRGLLCITKTADIEQAVAKAGKTPPFEMGNLQGVFTEIDQYVAANKTRPTYNIPLGHEMEGIDWSSAGTNYSLAKNYRMVDIGDRYLIVDPIGRPVCQDMDIGSIQKLGTPVAGSHLKSGRDAAHPEDNFYEEEMLNWRVSQISDNPYSPFMGGGAGGSARHIIEQNKLGKKPWKPRDANGNYNKEDLYVFLPINRGGGWTSELYKINGWSDFETFCRANGLDFPF